MHVVLSAQPTEILGTKLKLSRQRALGLELGRLVIGLTSRKQGNEEIYVSEGD